MLGDQWYGMMSHKSHKSCTVRCWIFEQPVKSDGCSSILLFFMDHFSKCAQICREFFFSNLFRIFFSNYFFSFIVLNYFLIFFFLNFFFHFFCFNFFFPFFFLNFLFISFFVLILPQKKIFKNVFKTALSNLSKNAFSNLLHQKIHFINFFENTFSNCSLKSCCLSLTLLKIPVDNNFHLFWEENPSYLLLNKYDLSPSLELSYRKNLQLLHYDILFWFWKTFYYRQTR